MGNHVSVNEGFG